MERRHDLDWLRVGAVLLLLPFHSARVFDPMEDFYVHSPTTSEPLFWSVVAFVSMWQMELLFVLAGAASWFAFGRRTAGQYRAERVRRLLVPFLFGLVAIVPIQQFLAIAWRDGGSSITTFTTDYWGMQGEIGGYDGAFTFGHLWFIFYLFLYSLVAAPLFARWHARGGQRRWARWFLWLMPVVVVVAGSVPYPDDGPQHLLYSFALFVGGFLLVSDARLERSIDDARRWLVPLVLWSWVSGTWDRLQDDGAISLLLDLAEAATMWAVVLALLGLGRRFLSFETSLLRRANEGAYPVYLLHQSVIVVVAYVVLEAWTAPAVAGWIVVTTLSLVVSVGLYEVAVRPWNPVRALFGMKPRASRVAAGVPAIR